MDKNKAQYLQDLAFILLASLLMLAGLIASGNWPQSHDGLRYLCHLDQFKDAFDSGILYPRWMPNYYGGYGYPVFVFYQPAYFFFTLVFTYVVPDILLASYASNIGLFFIGGAGVLVLTRKLTGNRAVSLFCSVMFLLTPYVYVNLYVRGDLSELMAMFVVPWILFLLIILKEKIAAKDAILPCVLMLSLVTALLVYSHPFTAMFFYPLYFAIMLVMSLELDKSKRLTFILAGTGAILCATVFSSPYWLAAFQLKKYVDYSTAVGAHDSAAGQLVYFHQLFSRQWGFGLSRVGPDDGMSFQLGLPHFLLAVAGFWMNRRNKFWLAVFILYLACIIGMMPVSRILWASVPLLNFVQFPWRLLSVIAVLQIICIAGIFRMETFISSNFGKYLLLTFIILVSLAWNSNQFQFVKFKFDIRQGIIYSRVLRLDKLQVYESYNEYLPKTAAANPPFAPRGKGPMIEVSDPNCRIEEYTDSNPHHMKYRVSSAVSQMIVINQLYFPGFKVYLNDKLLDDKYLLGNITADGRMQIEIPALKDQYLEIFYDGPPGWYLRNCIVAMVLILMLSLIVLEHKKKLKLYID